MAKPVYHAENSVRHFGGVISDYQKIHCKIDQSKSAHPKMSHRIIYHSDYGIELICKIFGEQLINTDGVKIDIASIVKQHIVEDLGFLPNLADWLAEFEHDNELITRPGLNCERHAEVSARNFGGRSEDYLEIHQLMNSPLKYGSAGRAIFHNAFGIYVVEDIFGVSVLNSSGRMIATREVAEQHVLRTYQKIPTLSDWLGDIDKPWMAGIKKVKLVLVD